MENSRKENYCEMCSERETGKLARDLCNKVYGVVQLLKSIFPTLTVVNNHGYDGYTLN